MNYKGKGNIYSKDGSVFLSKKNRVLIRIQPEFLSSVSDPHHVDGDPESFSLWCGSGSVSYLSLWCGSGSVSYLSLWCGSGSYLTIRCGYRSESGFYYSLDPDQAFHFDADPGPTIYSDADPDPTLQSDADPAPDPDPTTHWIRIKLFTLMRNRILPFNLWCGSRSGSYHTIWSGSYYSLFPRFGPSNAPKLPSKASTFSLLCWSGSSFLKWSGSMRIRIHNTIFKIRIHRTEKDLDLTLIRMYP